MKNKNKRILYTSVFLVFIVFPTIFFPIYIRSKRSSINEQAILQINTIECTDQLQSGSYTLKISIINRLTFKKYPIQLQGSQLESYGMNLTISKKIQNSFGFNVEDILVFVKLRRRVKTEIVSFNLNNHSHSYTWSSEMWFGKFGGSIKINYRFFFGI
jgi:hypothetical protein